MNILIVKYGALGDVLRTTSLLAPLRRRYPGCRIQWLTVSSALPLLENNPFIERAFTLDTASKRVSRFDLVLSLEENKEAADYARSRGGELIGVYSQGEELRYTASSAGYYDMSLLHRDPGGGHKAADVLKAKNKLTYAELWLKTLGLPTPKNRRDLAPVLHLRGGDRLAARSSAKRWGLRPAPIGLNPGAGARWPAKQLSCEKAASLLKALSRLGRPLLLFGGREESERNARILFLARGLGVPRLHDAGTGRALRCFAGFIELCEVVISTDSLALHVATALRKKTVILVGPTSSTELDVFGLGVQLTPSPACSCFYKSNCLLPVSCLDGMPDERVVAAVARLIRSK